MACNSMSISSSSIAKDLIKDQKNLRRSQSSSDLYNGGRIKRSYSDHHLYYSIRASASPERKLKNSQSLGKFPFQISSAILPNSIKSFLFDAETSKDMNIDVGDEDEKELEEKVVEAKEVAEKEVEEVGEKRANWVERLLEIRSHWKKRQETEDGSNGGDSDHDVDDGCEEVDEDDACDADYSDNDNYEDGLVYDREAFSKLLSKVDLSDTKLFSQLAFLCNMAYAIPDLKAKDLRKQYRLRLVTSSIEKKEEAAAVKAKFEEDSIRVPVPFIEDNETSLKVGTGTKKKHLGRPSVAYDIAASAATYVQSHTKGLFQSFGSETQMEGNHLVESCANGDCPRQDGESMEGGSSLVKVCNSEVAAYVAASTMTAVVAAGEKAKLEAARDLQSLHSSPCEWFVCDDYSTYTRCFVIQGSDSVASWHANLFFEPTKFEGTDVLVHRGIYEAAKGIYEQFMPEIKDHLNTFGDRAKFQFTGHSLGGSLALLVNLMLLSRKVVKPSVLRPVVTFGSPFIFCGGQKILEQLGLDQDHVKCVMMHRDVVPRAFSCNYPNYVTQLLKRLSGTFRSHPCLSKNKLLYSPMGKVFIIQPDEKASPPHPLLPPGSCLYSLEKNQSGSATNALRTFLNTPHPLETLSDPTAYGSEGTILRDHDSKNYLKAVNGVLRQHTKMVVRGSRQQGNKVFRPMIYSPSTHEWIQKTDKESNTILLSTKVMITGV